MRTNISKIATQPIQTTTDMISQAPKTKSGQFGLVIFGIIMLVVGGFIYITAQPYLMVEVNYGVHVPLVGEFLGIKFDEVKFISKSIQAKVGYSLFNSDLALEKVGFIPDIDITKVPLTIRARGYADGNLIDEKTQEIRASGLSGTVNGNMMLYLPAKEGVSYEIEVSLLSREGVVLDTFSEIVEVT